MGMDVYGENPKLISARPVQPDFGDATQEEMIERLKGVMGENADMNVRFSTMPNRGARGMRQMVGNAQKMRICVRTDFTALVATMLG